MKAFHISFEGTNGAGKSTQAKILVKHLCDYGIPTEYVKNPNGTAFGRAVMDAILAQSPYKLAEILAFAACFCQTANELVVPLMKRGICVVSDRGIGSAYAHALYRCRGAIGEKLFAEIMTEINKDNVLFPDLTFLLSLSVEKGVARKKCSVSRNRLDALTPDSAREALAYEKLSKKFPNWVTINANGSIDKISKRIWAETIKLLRRCADEQH